MEKLKNIPFTEISSIPQPVRDFLEQKISGYEDLLFTEENIQKKIRNKNAGFSTDSRKQLFETLNRQYAGTRLSEKQQKYLNALQQVDTYTVTTGHQLNLFTGPVFFIYKILQTIKLSEHLNQTEKGQFVPVFWLASEDHDFEEIRYFKTARGYYEINGASGGAVGRINVHDHQFIAQFEDDFRDTVFGTELTDLINRAYAEGNTLTQATRIIVQELFSEFGLLVIDGDDPQLKKQMVSIFKEELLEHKLEETTQDTVRFLAQTYGKVQVNPREINLFYLSRTRDRIVREGEFYKTTDQGLKFSQTEILTELTEHPERFSPNALLRPVYQETVLPNIAYIGGNAEIMYWLELKNYFEHLEQPFPVLIPRSSVLILNEKQISKTGKLGISVKDLVASVDAVARKILLENHQLPGILASLENQLKEQFSVLKVKAALTEKTFRNLVEAEETRQLKSFKRMRKRLLRAEKIKQKEQLASLNNLYASVHPGNVWQERTWNFSVFYAEHGRSWIHQCYNAITPYCSELIIFSI